MREALRSLIALGLCLAFASLALAKPASRDPVPQPRAKPQIEASLHAPVAPPPIVASGLPVPRWVTIKAPRVNVRRGPALDQPVVWTYVRPGVPVEVIAEYDSWRRIRDAEGGTGWVKSAMLDGRRNVMVTGRVNTAILGAPKADADAVAFASPGLVAQLVSCAGEWCEISTRGYDGFVSRDRLWGVHDGERVN
jgi:SH3-like domain-containing protein